VVKKILLNNEGISARDLRLFVRS
ncbi:MAG: hypothetical protein RLZZ494_1828, partial [Pseudomonadota bacterium]